MSDWQLSLQSRLSHQRWLLRIVTTIVRLHGYARCRLDTHHGRVGLQLSHRRAVSCCCTWIPPQVQTFIKSQMRITPRYHYPKFIGGILLITLEHFHQADGMSNQYWGWGLEDDEFYLRLSDAQLRLYRPTKLSTNENNTFRHIHDRVVRRRDTARIGDQRNVRSLLLYHKHMCSAHANAIALVGWARCDMRWEHARTCALKTLNCSSSMLR